MGTHSLKLVQRIPASLSQVWDLVANVSNLAMITPPEMKMRIISISDDLPLHEGQLIKYKLRPLLNIPVDWITVITQVKSNEFFIDEQKKGPFRKWQHTHHFKEIGSAVEMTDTVVYQLPMGILGDFVHALLVKRRLIQLFKHRFTTIEQLFGAWPGAMQIEIK